MRGREKEKREKETVDGSMCIFVCEVMGFNSKVKCVCVRLPACIIQVISNILIISGSDRLIREYCQKVKTTLAFSH